jgi:hypothetical protein
MSFARSARTDRRRRVMREAIAADAELVVESSRIRKRRSRELDESDVDSQEVRRDPGYSQAVRRACQQRMVQLIPVRSSSLWLVIVGIWSLWAGLIAAHYLTHIRSTSTSLQWPISFLVHLRSTHGIAHWLGSQLWMLTAIAALMIFQIRKHKLDDYRAKYRLWVILAVASLVSSLDVSSSGLFLLGKSLDPWTIREFGYSGWTVVLTTFATLVGVLGLRLCSELKVAPLSVAFWLVGLMSWACSALVGTGLIVSPWTQPLTDLIVGGAWLGGIIAVFLSAGIYLRHIYIEAQRRFIVRNRLIKKRSGWKLPRLSLGRKNRSENSTSDEGLDNSGSISKREKRVSKRAAHVEVETDQENVADIEQAPRRRFGLPSFGLGRRRSTDDAIATSRQSDDQGSKHPQSKSAPSGEAETSESVRRKWLRLPRWRSSPKLGEEYSDVSAQRRARDEGFEEPMKKAPGWLSKRKPQVTEEESSNAQASRQKSATNSNEGGENGGSSHSKRQWFKRREKAESANADPKAKRRWLSRKPRVDSTDSETKVKRSWFSRKAPASSTGQIDTNTPAPKKTWGLGRKATQTAVAPNKSSHTEKATSEAKPKRALFGFMDNLKLKPPQTATPSNSPKAVDTSRSPIPSSSTAQRNDQRSSATENSPVFEPAYDDEDQDDGSNRHLSKAERKRLRRQQDGRRAA